MGSTSKIVHHVINYNCTKFGAFTTKPTILSPFCRTKIPQPDYNSYDWQNDKCKYPQHIIGEMPSWIKSKQDTFLVALPRQNISISTFSDMQAHAYNIIRKHSKKSFSKRPIVSHCKWSCWNRQKLSHQCHSKFTQNILRSDCHHWQSCL